jgi:hypothetical protein
VIVRIFKTLSKTSDGQVVHGAKKFIKGGVQFYFGSTPLKRGKLAKNGVHWQTLVTSKSREKSDEPTRDILPDDCLPRKGANRKRKHPRSQLERQTLYLRRLWANIYDNQGHNFLSSAHKPEIVMCVIVLLAYGCPIQAIVKAFLLDERTVRDWQKRAGQHCQQVHEHLVESSQYDLEQVQADDTCTARKCR